MGRAGWDHLASWLSFCRFLMLSSNFLVKRWLALPQYVCMVFFSFSSRGLSRKLTASSSNGYCTRKTNQQVDLFNSFHRKHEMILPYDYKAQRKTRSLYTIQLVFSTIIAPAYYSVIHLKQHYSELTMNDATTTVKTKKLHIFVRVDHYSAAVS